MSVKILYIITRLDRGGSAEAVLQWAEGIRKRNFEVKIITGKTAHPQMDFQFYSRQSGVAIEIIDALHRELEPVNDLLALWRLIRIIKHEKPDLVHTNTSKAGILGRIAAKLNRVPVIIHSPHGHIFFGYYGTVKTKFFIALEKWAGRFTDKIADLTSLGVEDHIRLKIAPKEKFKVIYAGIDMEKYRSPLRSREHVRKEFNIPQQVTVVGWVGRLDNIKNPLLLIEAANLLRSENSLHFLMVGNGKLAEETRQLTNKYGLSDHFTFTGHRTDVPDLLSAMDIFALTSLNEGLGRSILEAQSAGIPVIATQVGGVPEIISNYETGLLIPSEDSVALAEAIRNLINDRQLRQKLASNARGQLPKFSLQKTLDNLEKLYRELLYQC